MRSLRPGASWVSGSSKKSNSKSVSRLLMAKRWNPATVTGASVVIGRSDGRKRSVRRPNREKPCPLLLMRFPRGARPRPLSAAAPARQRRLGLGLARPRRAKRARRGAQDRPARGQGRAPRRARGRGRGAAAARALPARVRLRQRLRPRLHRLRVRRRPHPARGDALRRAAGRSGDRGRGADPRGARARARPRHHPSRRQAVERPARRGRRDLGAAARLRPGAVRRGRDADRGRRRPRHARLHLARAAARRGGLLGQ